MYISTSSPKSQLNSIIPIKTLLSVSTMSQVVTECFWLEDMYNRVHGKPQTNNFTFTFIKENH